MLSEDLSADPAAVTCDGTYSASQGATRLTVGRLLEFERDRPRPCSAKDEDIRQLLGTTPSHYYVLLGRAIDTDDAAALDPIFTRRLREQRDRRLAARAARATVRPRPAASL
ncbi:DUF3263 domain-containing protein [Microbacterium halophytorum]|uniref:DUF3263 domain-containing protein n=1 Tax=Microbacterium halophytorum TaxID=2067568 RepID=UPI0018E07B1A|nr:DUF3263 domain-containing protein [Microbacterium halophytorum]